MAASPAHPPTSYLTDSKYELLAICQFLSNRCLIATSFHARLVKLQSACGARTQIWAGAVVSQLPKLLGAEIAPDYFFLDCYLQTAVGLLALGPSAVSGDFPTECGSGTEF
jgi:hypothetical protein